MENKSQVYNVSNLVNNIERHTFMILLHTVIVTLKNEIIEAEYK